MRFRVHALAEGAVVLLPLLLMSPQFVVDPAAGLGAVHRQQLHIWEDRRQDRMEKEEEEEETRSAISPETRTEVVTLLMQLFLHQQWKTLIFPVHYSPLVLSHISKGVSSALKPAG